MSKRKPVRNYPPDIGIVDKLWGHEFLYSYPHELEDGLERLRRGMEHPQSEKGLTEVEYLLRRFVEDAEAFLRDEGYDPATISVHEENEFFVPLASARWIVVNADRVRNAIADGRSHDAAVFSMLIVASAIRMAAFGTVMDGAWKRVERKKGGKAKGHKKRTEILKRNQEILEIAEKLLQCGREKHEISGILARRFGLSQKTTRGILQRGGVLKKRESR